MSRPNALRALPPVWFRFTDEEDQGKYGTRWYCYDEAPILRLRAREQVALENEMGMTLVSAMNGFRGSSVLGDLAVTWIGVYRIDPDWAGDFEEYNPVTSLIEWSATDPEPPVGKGESPADMQGLPDSSSPTPEPLPNTTSETTDTVALQVLPIAE